MTAKCLPPNINQWPMMVHFIYWVINCVKLFTNNYAHIAHIFSWVMWPVSMPVNQPWHMWANKTHTFTRADITINNTQSIFLVQTYLASTHGAMMSVIQNYILFIVGNLHHSKQGKQGYHLGSAQQRTYFALLIQDSYITHPWFMKWRVGKSLS